jgi:four helix bundle protein
MSVPRETLWVRDLETRTQDYALGIIEAVRAMSSGIVPEVLGKQLLKSGTSVGANYREARRAESRKDFMHKLAIAEKEAAEACYWLELVNRSGMGSELTRALENEGREILAILVAAGRTAKRRNGS